MIDLYYFEGNYGNTIPAGWYWLNFTGGEKSRVLAEGGPFQTEDEALTNITMHAEDCAGKREERCSCGRYFAEEN